jgi:hypothetical protein
MRHVHHQRRVSKNARLANRMGAQAYVNVCNKFHPGLSTHRSNNSHSSRPRDGSERLDIVRHARTPPMPAQNNNIGDTGFWVLCVECGKMQVLSWPATDGNLYLDLSYASPRDIGSAGAFDPFNSTSRPITHSMHELMNHCKYSDIETWRCPLTGFNRHSCARKNVNPRIYGKMNLDVGALSYFLKLVTTDPLVLYAILSLAACHRFLCMNKKVNLDEGSDNTLVREALFYLFEAMRLL